MPLGASIGSSCVHLQPYRGFGPNQSPFFSVGGGDPHGQLLSLEMGPAPCDVMAQESSGALLMSFGRKV